MCLFVIVSAPFVCSYLYYESRYRESQVSKPSIDTKVYVIVNFYKNSVILLARGITMNEKYTAPYERKEQARMLIKRLLQERQVQILELANMLNEQYGRSASSPNLVNKFSRSSFKLTEFLDIVEVLGYEIKLVSKTPIEGAEKPKSKP